MFRFSAFRFSWIKSLAALAVFAFAASAFAEGTERLYLSGRGKDDPVEWDFSCSAGQNANKPSKIGVPSNWELQGFGTYTYGEAGLSKNGGTWPKVEGTYKREFTAPEKWRDRKVYLVFEGVMTDTQASINGHPAGPMHQGGYYSFRYDISSLLHPGTDKNAIQVVVDDESANDSVNRAERRGDYWNYGGIYRPVYLEAMPKQSINRVAIDAKMDGSFSADLLLDGLPAAEDKSSWKVEGQILGLDGKPVGPAFSQPVSGDTLHIASKLDAPRLWTAETPNLYQVELRLKNLDNVIHFVRQKFGFRTLEIRNGGDNPGLFVNGQRIMLKGACRHSFWPDSGRCLSEAVTRGDVEIMKDMNMNAVRCTHYPPDSHFLDACDELGLYVLDEIGGWHAYYDTETGHKLVEEMVTHDVNHPSILFWDNGNEGGYNVELDDDYAKWDPQKRNVLHPGPINGQPTYFRGIDTGHYPNFAGLTAKAAGQYVYFPTEMLHGLYDGGAGASLEDYWNVMLKSKVSAGGFIWAFLDEDVKRTDKGGILDSYTNFAPDGIVGPYREKEGSYYTIKQIWSPIVLTHSGMVGDAVNLENRYSFTDANQCSYSWEIRRFKQPGESGAGFSVVSSGKAGPEGSIPPGKSGVLVLQGVNVETRVRMQSDALAVTVKDPAGKELWTWVWPGTGEGFYQQAVRSDAGSAANITETPDSYIASEGDLSLQFNRKSGQLASATRAGKTFSFNNGPRLVAFISPPPPPPRGRGPRGARGPGTATAPAIVPASAPASAPATAPAPSTLTSFEQKMDGNTLLLTASYAGPMKSITYRVRPSGWVQIDYSYALTGKYDYFGVGFDYPEANVKGMRYLGNGPYRVWKNRIPGGTLSVWDKAYNDTVTGDPDGLAPGAKFDYPEFKGYYAGMRWLQLETTEGPITAVLNQDDLFVQVFTPKFPPVADQGRTGVNFPDAGISFLHAIPPVGSKFVYAITTGPQAQPTVAQGEYKGSISLFFGELSH